MSDLSSLYEFLKGKGLVKICPEYEEELAEQTEQEEKKTAFIVWKDNLPSKEKEDFEMCFGSDSYRQ